MADIPHTPPQLVTVTLNLTFAETMKLMAIVKRLANTEPATETIPDQLLFPNLSQFCGLLAEWH